MAFLSDTKSNLFNELGILRQKLRTFSDHRKLMPQKHEDEEGLKWRSANFKILLFSAKIGQDILKKIATTVGSGCGSVDRAVASNTRGLWFKSSHQQNFILKIFTVNCEKTKIKEKEKEAGKGPFTNRVTAIASLKTISPTLNRLERGHWYAPTLKGT